MRTLFLSVALLLSPITAAPASDAISSLPGWGIPPSPQYSGFLNASAEEPGTMLHYWYAQSDAATAAQLPVVLWLNGGPGSSSILGMLQELGPLLINATGGLMRNPYSFTKQANLLILESPGGVGYSYCAAMLTGGSCSNTDKSTAKAARAALQDFFAIKFPELKANGLYIVGESYAGVYIPTLTEELLEHAPEIDIRGIAVGDPCTDTALQKESMDMLWYAHKHGLVPDRDFEFLRTNCSYRHPTFLARGHWRRKTAAQWEETVAVSTTNPDLQKQCKIVERRYLASTSRGISQSWDGAYLNELDLFADAAALDWSLPGTLNYFNAQWMMRDDVRAALHVTDAPAKAWPGPSADWEYRSDYSACNDAPAGTDSMIDFYRRIAPQLKTTIVFNGDVDPCVSYEGTRAAIEKVGFAVIQGGAYRPWFFNKTATTVQILKEKPSLFGPDLELREAGAQFGGQVVNYANRLSFATVHGSGHMVPQFRPQAAERLLHELLSHGAFAPLLPTNEEFGAMSDTEFDSTVDEWTAKAKQMI